MFAVGKSRLERTEGLLEWRPVVGMYEDCVVVISMLSSWNCFHPSGKRGDGWCISSSMV